MRTAEAETILARREQPGRANAEQCPRVLVVVDGSPADREVIRLGRIRAEMLHAPLILLHPFRPGRARASRAVLSQDRALAQAADAPLIELPVSSVLDGIVEFAQRRSITHLVLAGQMPARRRLLGPESLLARLLERLSDVDVYLVAGSERS